jgi:hypothetical protein
MGDFRSRLSYRDTIYKTLLLLISNHSRKYISAKNKNIRGEGVPLSDSSVRVKLRRGLTIDKSRERNSGEHSAASHFLK